jgi:hypothetical protein
LPTSCSWKSIRRSILHCEGNLERHRFGLNF